jgi:uncharacterized membrane protein required for colicin V production
MQFNWIDIFFLVTVALLAFNGFRNGAVVSLVNLLSIPLGIAVAYVFGKQFTLALGANGLSIAPFISYIVLFFATVLVLHIIATVVRGVVHRIPVVNFGDEILGAILGFIEAYLIWLVLLIVVGNFLHSTQDLIQQGQSVIPGLNISVNQFKSWHDTYNYAVTNSTFARVNSFVITRLPDIPKLPK